MGPGALSYEEILKPEENDIQVIYSYDGKMDYKLTRKKRTAKEKFDIKQQEHDKALDIYNEFISRRASLV